MTIKTGDRVHCDNWLAHRPDGWLIRDIRTDGGTIHAYVNGSVGLYLPVPIADCTLVPRPFKVGDWVRSALHGTGLVYAVMVSEVRVGFINGTADSYATNTTHLTHIDPPEAPNA